MISAIASHILTLPGWLALLVVFALPALESSAFVGFIFPGEVALILGGVIASQGRVSLAAVLAAAIAGAIVGDTVGYAVGRRYGRGILDSTLGRFVKASHLDRAEAYLAERGGKAVFFGRFTAALRVLIPGLAGMSGLRYRTFLAYNAASAVGWGTLSVLLGYLGGSNWRHVEQIASRTGLGALVLAAAVIAATILLRRRRNHPGARLGPAAAARARTSFRQSLRSVVVIPTYNEAGNIATAIDRVHAAATGRRCRWSWTTTAPTEPGASSLATRRSPPAVGQLCSG